MKSKRKIVLALAAVMLLGVLLTGCQKSADKNKLIVGLDDAFPPMGYRDDAGELIGFDVELAKGVGKRLGMEVTFQPIDWTIKEQELNSGNVDCLWNGFTITDERKETLCMSEAYMKNDQILIVMADSGVNTPADLAGKKLALQDGSSAADALEAEANKDFAESVGEVIKFDDNTKALMDLGGGGCDGVLMDSVVARFYVTEHPEYKVLDGSLAAEEYGIGFRKDDSELCKKVEGALKEMAADGTLAEISTKWFGEDVTTIK